MGGLLGPLPPVPPAAGTRSLRGPLWPVPRVIVVGRLAKLGLVGDGDPNEGQDDNGDGDRRLAGELSEQAMEAAGHAAAEGGAR